MLPQDLIGLHAPNRSLRDIPGGAPAFWRQATLGKATWVKLLFPDHSRADAERAKALGRRVIVRAPGEGICYESDLRLMLAEFAGVADVFELGNEPDKAGVDLFTHAWHVEWNARHVRTDCNRAGIRLISPGWSGNAEPPDQKSDIGRRIREVYSALDGIGFHAYGEHVLEGPQVGRIQRWAQLFPKMMLYGTEIGIAARDLVGVPPDAAHYEQSKLIKADRYFSFAGMLSEECDQVAAAVFFIADGCTPECVRQYLLVDLQYPDEPIYGFLCHLTLKHRLN
jgi:hypothetical protein